MNDDRFTERERERIDTIPRLTEALMIVLRHDSIPRRDVANQIRNAAQALDRLAWALREEKTRCGGEA